MHTLCKTYLLIFTSLLFSQVAVAKEYLYIHNTFSGEISKISIPEHEIVDEIEIGYYMDYLAKSPDNKTLYVNRVDGDLPGSRARNVGVSGELISIDVATNKINWQLPIDGMTHHMSVSKDGKLVFVPLYDTWWVAVVDVEQVKVIKKIFIGHGGHGSKVSADGERLYVGSMLNDSLTVIDTKTLEVVDQYGFRDGVRPFAITQDESKLYVQQSWLHGFVVVDTATREQTTIDLPDLGKEVKFSKFYPQNVNHGIALTPDEDELWIVGSVLEFVAVYSHPQLELKHVIPVGKDPNAIVFDGQARFAYVSNRKENTLSILDTEQYKEVKRIPLGDYPQRMVVIDVAE
ncbi:MAG: cytochrome D1 domain-containing protein [Pseudomonadota bacterium]